MFWITVFPEITENIENLSFSTVMISLESRAVKKNVRQECPHTYATINSENIGGCSQLFFRNYSPPRCLPARVNAAWGNGTEATALGISSPMVI